MIDLYPATRRHALFGAGALAALLPVPVLARAQQPPESTIQKLYAEYCDLCRASERVDKEAHVLRNRLITRWGNIPGNCSAQETWGHDPDYWLLGPANDRCNELDSATWDVADRILQTPATTLPEMFIKLRLVADIQPSDLTSLDGYEVDTIQFLQEAVQLLDRSAA